MPVLFQLVTMSQQTTVLTECFASEAVLADQGLGTEPVLSRRLGGLHSRLYLATGQIRRMLSKRHRAWASVSPGTIAGPAYVRWQSCSAYVTALGRAGSALLGCREVEACAGIALACLPLRSE